MTVKSLTLTLTIQLTQILTDYISTAKSADQDAKDILREAECLKDVLEHFEKFVEAEKFQGIFRASSALCGIIDLSNSKVRGLVSKLLEVKTRLHRDSGDTTTLHSNSQFFHEHSKFVRSPSSSKCSFPFLTIAD